MGYEGVKYKTIFLLDAIPSDPRIDELRKWCEIFHKNKLAPFYAGGTHGNMSFRETPGKNEIVITAARSSFAEFMTDDSFFTIHKVDFDKMELAVSGVPEREPSSETLLHFAIYKQRPDVQAILHGHCKGITKNAARMGIPHTKNAVESGNMKIVESVLEVLDQHNFLEIKEHGFMSMGASIEEAGDLAMEMRKRSEKIKVKR